MRTRLRRHFTLVTAVVVAAAALSVGATDADEETDSEGAGNLSKPILEQCEQSESLPEYKMEWMTDGRTDGFKFVTLFRSVYNLSCSCCVLQEFATRSGTARGTFSRGSTPRLATPPPRGSRRGTSAGGTAWTPSLWVRLPKLNFTTFTYPLRSVAAFLLYRLPL